MQKRRIISLLIIAVGIFLITYALYAMHRIQEAKSISSDIENFFTHNPSVWDPLITFFGGEAQKEISQYDIPVAIMFISGIVFTLGGAVATMLWWKKPRA